MIDPLQHLKDLIPLLKANWKESGNPFDFVPEDAMKTYHAMFMKQLLFCVAAYKDEQLVGYSVITLYPHPLNYSIKVCNVDGLYVTPELRGGTTAARIMASIKSLAKVHEAHLIHWHAPAGTGFSEALGNRYTPLSNYFREDL